MSAELLPSYYLGDQSEDSTLLEDAEKGLLRDPKSMPPKYFYDAVGSELFDQICRTPEYYPTRTEDRLLAESSAKIIAQLQPDHIVELGSGGKS